VAAEKLFRLFSSVRGWSEFSVVAPSAGAQKVRLPSALAVSHGGVRAAGSTMVALPFLPSSGRDADPAPSGILGSENGRCYRPDMIGERAYAGTEKETSSGNSSTAPPATTNDER